VRYRIALVFNLDEVKEMLAQAVASEREAYARLAENEPEPRGTMPEQLKNSDHETLARAAVKATKRGIAKAIREGE
jgi:hypothetical protein